ncbi:hypothetical protein PPO43_13620 [Saprospira sp. CCB-QB6]|uniref:hypothetical protein n=1 Tax=Saprospira sp. CCB-QB6 TaxID=3023936 RepID=UPI00234A58FE|nr:hypothetical protein [Saprospira sp. CCB-QB6]WCL81008.1 hypothetical protein PPO43_13620 [Saprospira sp. CCB-QB6]
MMIRFSLLFLVLCYAPFILYAQKEDSSANIIVDGYREPLTIDELIPEVVRSEVDTNCYDVFLHKLDCIKLGILFNKFDQCESGSIFLLRHIDAPEKVIGYGELESLENSIWFYREEDVLYTLKIEDGNYKVHVKAFKIED